MSAAPPAGLRRAHLAEGTLVRLQRASWRAPDVLLVDTEAGRVVVKDFEPCARLVRATLGRWLIAREVRAYRRLQGHPSVPRLLGRLDALAFVVEHRGGVPFTCGRPWTFTVEFGRRLDDAVRAMHERGVAHLDLRHRSNVRAGMDGRPVLIDFASAVTFRPGSAAARILLPLFARADRRALRKWRARLSPS